MVIYNLSKKKTRIHLSKKFPQNVLQNVLLWKISKLRSKHEAMLKQLRTIHQVLHRILLKNRDYRINRKRVSRATTI